MIPFEHNCMFILELSCLYLELSCLYLELSCLYLEFMKYMFEICAFQFEIFGFRFENYVFHVWDLPVQFQEIAIINLCYNHGYNSYVTS